jgi:hypothetical protein
MISIVFSMMEHACANIGRRRSESAGLPESSVPLARLAASLDQPCLAASQKALLQDLVCLFIRQNPLLAEKPEQIHER